MSSVDILVLIIHRLNVKFCGFCSLDFDANSKVNKKLKTSFVKLGQSLCCNQNTPINARISKTSRLNQ